MRGSWSDTEFCYQEQWTSRTVSISLTLRIFKYRKQTEMYKRVLTFRTSNNASAYAVSIFVLIKLFKISVNWNSTVRSNTAANITLSVFHLAEILIQSSRSEVYSHRLSLNGRG
jgi:hypothetical protein